MGLNGGPNASAGTSLLRAVVADSPFVFVAGKGGVGKTTAAGALALELADAGVPTHLISTDPAHSIADLFGREPGGRPAASPCTDRLTLEEFDADAYAREWLDHATGPVGRIIEAGTYLDEEDVAGFTRLALPGLDEMMAVLRLVELADAGQRVIVDTAPTGHTLRLLDAGAVHAGIAAALRAMADKAAAVASGLTRRAVRLEGETIIEELEAHVADYTTRVLRPAAFVVVTRPDPVVAAETGRLIEALQERRLRVVATVANAAEPAVPPSPATPAGPLRLAVPLLSDATGCEGLRAWRQAIARGGGAAGDQGPRRHVTAPSGRPALPWMEGLGVRVLFFAGKGGVGKSTCAAAAALALAQTRDVLLCSADPAGSLDDVLGMPATMAGRAAPRLRVLQVDAAAQLARLREEHRAELLATLERLGVSERAALDRRVMEALWDLAPPGIDEFAALAAMLDAAASEEMIIVDTAPTGHFLRLLSMPSVALDWTRQLMRVIVKYRAADAAAGAAESLLQTARELRGLQDLLADGGRSGVVAVTLPEPLVLAETDRLLSALRAAGVPLAAVLHNRSTGVASAAADVPVISAPVCAEPPIGGRRLQQFIESWKIVA